MKMETLVKNMHIPKCYFHFVFFEEQFRLFFSSTFCIFKTEITKIYNYHFFMEKPLKMCPLTS